MYEVMELFMNRLAYIPIDHPLPNYDKEKFFQWFEQNKADQRNHSVGWYTYQPRINWNCGPLGVTQVSHMYTFDDNWHWKSEFTQGFPEIVAHIEQLPFKKLAYVSLTQNFSAIPPHRDITPKFKMHENDFSLAVEMFERNEPALYRIVYYGDSSNYFFVGSPENRVYTRLPASTGTFAMGGVNAYHGTEMSPQPKILAFVTGLLDEEKHQDLVARSYEKYKEYAIFENSWGIA
jgi:hypothetical protein